jgi:trimeric autotransporter adhesin
MNLRFCSRFAAFVPSRFTCLFASLLTLLAGAAQLSAQNIINTIAGGGTLPPFSTSATGNYADIPGPTSIVVDQQGNLYVVSPSANQVYKVDPTGSTLSVFAGQGWPAEDPQKYDGEPATKGYLNAPSGLAIDGSGNIYVADTQAYLVRKIDTNGIMTTIAGTGDLCQNPPSGCHDNGPATLALLGAPAGVATDVAGNVYIADTGDNEIRVVNMQSSTITVYGVTVKPGNIARVAGNGKQCSSGTSACGDNLKGTNAMLNGPNGVAVDRLGNMFIADSGDRRIRAMIPSGNIYAYAGNGNPCSGGAGSCGDGGASLSAQLSNPWQIYIDASDNLYIADSPTNRIRKVTPGTKPPGTATISTIAGNGASCSTAYVKSNFCGDGGSATSAYLNGPHGVTLDASKNLYISDSGDQRIRKVSSGTINTYAGGGMGDGPATTAIFAENRDVAVDNAGNVYIADTNNNRIRKISGGTVSTLAGNGIGNYFGNGILAVNANLSQPWGLTVDGLGNVYVADTNNLVVRVVNTQSSPITVAGVVIQPGTIATVAGIAGQGCVSAPPGCGDGGPATQATFGYPAKVALDNAGNFLVADSSANRIREVNISTGVISTVAGNGSACPDPTNFALCGDGGAATAAMLNQPHSIAVDSVENIYIADTMDDRIRVVEGSGPNAGDIEAFGFNGTFNNFGPDFVAALQSGYTEPLYVSLDANDNVFVSGSSIYYLIQRIDASTNPVVNPVDTIAGRSKGDPKYYGFAGDGGPAYGAYLNNYGATLDSSENLYISDGGNNRVREVSSSPTQGLVPVVSVSPTSLTFPPTPIGSTSQPMNITVTNTGSNDLVMSAPSISGPFNFVNQTPCPGNIVAPGMSCVYSVVFTPTGYGNAKGTATLNDNGFNSSQQNIPLSGSSADFSIAANPNSLTIARGTQGQSTITLTPVAGFNQNITLSCTALPQGVSCGYVPNPVPMDGSTAQTSTLTVTVSSSATPGTYTINAKGSSATTHTTPITLTVQ